MDGHDIPRQKAGYEVSDLDGECLVYNGQEAKALCLNETASLIWKLCDGHRSVAAIEELLRGAYPEASSLREDVAAAFRDLMDHGVLEVG